MISLSYTRTALPVQPSGHDILKLAIRYRSVMKSARWAASRMSRTSS